MLWVKGLSVSKKGSRITLGLPWWKKRMNNFRADVGIQGRADKLMLLIDVETTFTLKTLAGCQNLDPFQKSTYVEYLAN